METSHPNFPNDPTQKFSRNSPMIGLLSQTDHVSKDDKQN